MSNPANASTLPAKFLSGSIIRHIWVMTTTSALGLVGVFLVDLVDILFLSMLDNDDIIAGVGFAASLSFFTVSLSIGITISMAALVSRMIGQRNVEQARRYVVNVATLALLLTSVLAAIIWVNLPLLLGLLGASDGALDVGVSYLQILLPSLPILATGMAMSAALRAVGDARLSMLTTLSGGAVNAVLDPIFIFALAWGVEGAAVASLIGRIVVLILAFYGVTNKHKLMKRFVLADFFEDLKPIFKIAGPAMLTNMSTPIGNAIVIKAVATYGSAYVAGFAIVGRISPVAFALVFSLSGAIAPIIGQNFGAYNFDRIYRTLRDSLYFNIAYVSLVSLFLFILQQPIIDLFKLQGEAAQLMELFCTWLAITFMFNGAQFISNAAFNNLGKPMYATWFNVGKSTVGTLPFVIVGGQLAQANGVLIGQAVGGMLFATAGVWMAFWHLQQLRKAHQRQHSSQSL
ncbi:MATE family efflux transporter [Oceanicoccus sp. KOV_DT_Chl]|uniref:MATE family efflux transporter n=1 Tax=Oceanicoccus sp. KOV_DT_Chl TaxID=1904639 RepID=UPI000C7C0D06|nr:MATE family efflux transporter [Oceanicoccus sp. KOV_DT_Chl]